MLRGVQRGSRGVRLRRSFSRCVSTLELEASSAATIAATSFAASAGRVQGAERLRLLLEVLGVGQRGGELGGILAARRRRRRSKRSLSDTLAELVVLALAPRDARRRGRQPSRRVVPARRVAATAPWPSIGAKAQRGARRPGRRPAARAAAAGGARSRTPAVRFGGRVTRESRGRRQSFNGGKRLFVFRTSRVEVPLESNGKVGISTSTPLGPDARGAPRRRARSGRRVCLVKAKALRRRASPRVNAGGSWAAESGMPCE